MTPPSGEYLTAFSMRLPRIWRSFSASAATAAGTPWSTTISTSGGRWARAASIERSSASPASQLSISNASCWESSRLASRTSFTILASRSASLAITPSRRARCSPVSVSSRWISVTAAPEADAGDREPELPPPDFHRERLSAPRGRGRLGGDGDPRGQLPPARYDPVGIAAEHAPRGEAGDRLGGRIPEPDDPLAVDHEDAVTDVGENERRPRALLGLAVQSRVVDREACAPSDLLGERQVGVGVPPSGLRPGERDRSDDVAS